MSRKKFRIFILILTISIGLLTITEGVCDINSYIDNLNNNQMYSLNWLSGLNNTLNYSLAAQMQLNFFSLGSTFNGNLFKNNLFNSGIRL